VQAVAPGRGADTDKVGSVHDMRFVFFDNDTKLLFASTYDGDWETYINDFATLIPDALDLVFSQAEGWPGIRSPQAKDYIAKYQPPWMGCLTRPVDLLFTGKPGDFRPTFVSPVIRAESRKCRSVVGRTSAERLLTSSPSVDRSAQSADRRTRMANRSRTERSVVIVHAT
jgi:hypothetical protein